MKKKILCLSFDETVSASRRAALEHAGYGVAAITKVADALGMISSAAFDLLILGHRFAASDRYKLASEARKRGTPVLLICGAAADLDVPADARVYALEGTAGLVATVVKLLAKPAVTSAA